MSIEDAAVAALWWHHTERRTIDATCPRLLPHVEWGSDRHVRWMAGDGEHGAVVDAASLPTQAEARLLRPEP